MTVDDELTTKVIEVFDDYVNDTSYFSRATVDAIVAAMRSDMATGASGVGSERMSVIADCAAALEADGWARYATEEFQDALEDVYRRGLREGYGREP